MSLIIATIPDNADYRPRWLDKQLVGDRLGDVVDELSALGKNRPTDRPFNDLLGDHRAELLERGTVALPSDVWLKLIQSPVYLLELQELVLLEGGQYWESLARPATLIDSVKRTREAILNTIQPSETAAEIAIPVRAMREWLRWTVSFATAACLFIGGLIVWQQMRTADKPVGAVAWGWAKPDAVPQTVTTDEYYAALVAGGEQWFAERPDDPAGLAKRLNEMRQNCSVLIVSNHPPLSEEQQRDLKDRCRKWAAQFDAALVRLENGDDPVTVRADVDTVVTKLVSYLNSKRQA